MGDQTRGAQPPPVEQQNPVWMPGSRCAGGEVGVVVAVAGRGAVERRARSRGPRGRAPARARRGVPSSSSPTTSWPGTNGKLTQSSKYVEAWPSIIDRSEPQIPARRVRTRCQPGPGSSGGSIVGVLERPDRAAARPTRRQPSRATADLQRQPPSLRRRSCGAVHRGTAPVHVANAPAALALDHHAGRSAAAGGGRRWPSTSARRASRACGRSRRGGSRG